MTQEQREEIQKYKTEVSVLQGKIKHIESCCKHENTRQTKYLDYDRNCYEVVCFDCETVLFDGNKFEFERYMNRMEVDNNG